MKTTTKLTLALLITCGAAITAQAQSWPSGAIRVPNDPCPRGYYQQSITNNPGQPQFGINGGAPFFGGSYQYTPPSQSRSYNLCVPVPRPQTMPNYFSNVRPGPMCPVPQPMSRRR